MNELLIGSFLETERVMVDSKAVSGVKRCLFGQPDHERVRAELVKQLSIIIKQDKEKYNFDFTAGKPLEGKFDWEEVEAVPSTQTHAERTTPSLDSSPSVTVPDCPRLKHPELKTPVKKCTNRVSKCDKMQPSIRDFLPTKKRVGGTLKRQSSDSCLTGLVKEVLPIKRMCSQHS